MGKTLIEWLLDLRKKVNEIIARVNTIYSVPSGGTTGQVLTKSGPADYDLEWQDQEAEAKNGIPSGGTTGQVLAKKSNADYAAEWVDQQSGSGDVTAAGNNNFTGDNTFTRPVSVPAPAADGDAVNRKYVNDSLITNKNETIEELEGGDNTFTGSNTFTDPVTVGEGTAPEHAAQVKQVTELGNELNTVAGNAVNKDSAQEITGKKTFAVPPVVPVPTAETEAANKKYVDDTVSTAGAKIVENIESNDNMFTGNNTFAEPVSVGEPTTDSQAATKGYTDGKTAENNTMRTTGTAGQVWTKNDAGGEWKDSQGGGGGTDHGIPAGGATGQMLTKKSNTDYDADWRTPNSYDFRRTYGPVPGYGIRLYLFFGRLVIAGVYNTFGDIYSKFIRMYTNGSTITEQMFNYVYESQYSIITTSTYNSVNNGDRVLLVLKNSNSNRLNDTSVHFKIVPMSSQSLAKITLNTADGNKDVVLFDMANNNGPSYFYDPSNSNVSGLYATYSGDNIAAVTEAYVTLKEVMII